MNKVKSTFSHPGFSRTLRDRLLESICPVEKFTNHIFLAIVVTENLEVHQMDIKPTSLNGNLNEDIFLVHPKGFINHECSDHVRKL